MSRKRDAFDGIYEGRRVLVTGHTGFKGSWLTLWLLRLGADVTGFALPPDTRPSLFEDLGLEKHVRHVVGDVRDTASVERAMQESRPEILFHLAAQPLVRRSYVEPAYTYETNLFGTLNVLESVRGSESVRAGVVITTDKVYRNLETGEAFSEDDCLGGLDPYSASKACCELLVGSHRASFLKNRIGIAAARAGNVIGGGDWAEDRLIPDCVRALSEDSAILIRNPASMRPWQHVLEPLSGYLLLGKRLFEGDSSLEDAWNFGPRSDDDLAVEQVVELVLKSWGSGSWESPDIGEQPHEAALLRLNIAKAARILGWSPLYSAERAIEATVSWYARYLGGEQDAAALCERDIADYESTARASGVVWAT